jgi:hypothetical protein
MFVAFSLTPYLAVKREPQIDGVEGSAKATSSTDKPQPMQPAQPFAVLQALFGEGDKETNSTKQPSDKLLATIVSGESYKGMVLRPELKDFVRLVPPVPRTQVFKSDPNERKFDQVTIPFYGVYWFFRASERTLPLGAVESRGSPDALSFRTTDFSPMAMEARQNFGTFINLSCCQAIQVVISNGDRRPNTVSVELIVLNTKWPGRPRQSLGIAPGELNLGLASWRRQQTSSNGDAEFQHTRTSANSAV